MCCWEMKQPVLNARGRPSNSRIQELEEENKRLHARLGSPLNRQSDSLSNKPPEPKSPLPDAARSSLSGHNSKNPEWFRKKPLEDTRPEKRANHENGSDTQRGESNYYGLTSTLFDDSPNDPRSVEIGAVDPQIPLEWVQRGLMAEATRQRELPIFIREIF